MIPICTNMAHPPPNASTSTLVSISMHKCAHHTYSQIEIHPILGQAKKTHHLAYQIPIPSLQSWPTTKTGTCLHIHQPTLNNTGTTKQKQPIWQYISYILPLHNTRHTTNAHMYPSSPPPFGKIQPMHSYILTFVPQDYARALPSSNATS